LNKFGIKNYCFICFQEFRKTSEYNSTVLGLHMV